MSFKIYTKTGDLGKTSLIGGKRVFKSDPRIEAYGTVDELNSHIGLVADFSDDPALKASLRQIQDRLFTIGSELACDPGKQTKMSLPELYETDVEFLEREIDGMNESLPEMKHFILPGGLPVVSFTHIARCVCRRAERCCVDLEANEGTVDPLVIKYLNRLSDYLFILARYLGMKNNAAEIAWRPKIR